jgi:hypothetical protein
LNALFEERIDKVILIVKVDDVEDELLHPPKCIDCCDTNDDLNRFLGPLAYLFSILSTSELTSRKTWK